MTFIICQGCFSNIYERTNVNVYKCWLIANDFCVSKFLHIITDSLEWNLECEWTLLNRSNEMTSQFKWLPFTVSFNSVYLNLQHMTVTCFWVINHWFSIINIPQHLLSHVSLENLAGHLPQLDGGLLLDEADHPLLHQPLGVALLLEDNVPKLHRLQSLPVLGEVLKEKAVFWSLRLIGNW